MQSLKDTIFGTSETKKEEQKDKKEFKNLEKERLRQGHMGQTMPVKRIGEEQPGYQPGLQGYQQQGYQQGLQHQQGFQQQGFQQQNVTTREVVGEASIHRQDAPSHIEKIEKAPVVHERFKPIQEQEIQPIIYREREQTEVRQVLQPIFQKSVAATSVSEKTLPSEYLPEVFVTPTQDFKYQYEQGAKVAPSSVTETVETHRIVKPAIVQETIRRNIVEEIQPVIEKETIMPEIIRATKPVYVKIHEAPTLTKETREPIYLQSGENLSGQLGHLGLGETPLHEQYNWQQQSSFTSNIPPAPPVQGGPLGEQINLEHPNIIGQQQTFEKKLPVSESSEFKEAPISH